ncbi:TRAP transporter large permease subunit, partial [Vibrio diabolicus]
MFSAYCYFYAGKSSVENAPRANWKERWATIRKAVLPFGFPIITVGGIYAGVFSPTEAASVSVLYAVLLEMVIFRKVKWKELGEIALSTGMVT